LALTDSPRIPAARDLVARDTRSVIAGTQQRESTALHPAPAPAVAELDRVRAAVSAALSDFLDVQRQTLAAMDDSLLPLVDEVRALADGGKRLRPLFAYWGWRGVRGDELPLAAALPERDPTHSGTTAKSTYPYHTACSPHSDG